MSSTLKKTLYRYCQKYVNERIALVSDVMHQAQEAANSETKGSAGDKHETGRAMMHREKEQHARQLAEHLKLKKVLAQINPEETHETTRLGSLIFTNTGIYYLAIPIGKVEIDGEIYFIISPVSPIGKLLMGTKVEAELSFNGKRIGIERII